MGGFSGCAWGTATGCLGARFGGMARLGGVTERLLKVCLVAGSVGGNQIKWGDNGRKERGKR
jgi:hypothetical protein